MFPRRFCPLFAVYGIPAFTTVLFEMIKGCVGVGEEGGVVFTVPGIETDAHTDRDAVAIGVVDLGKTGSDLAAAVSDDIFVQGVAGKDSEFVPADASGDRCTDLTFYADSFWRCRRRRRGSRRSPPHPGGWRSAARGR